MWAWAERQDYVIGSRIAARSMTCRTRSPTCSTDSPWGTGLVQIDHPGSALRMSGVVRPS